MGKKHQEATNAHIIIVSAGRDCDPVTGIQLEPRFVRALDKKSFSKIADTTFRNKLAAVQQSHSTKQDPKQGVLIPS